MNTHTETMTDAEQARLKAFLQEKADNLTGSEQDILLTISIQGMMGRTIVKGEKSTTIYRPKSYRWNISDSTIDLMVTKNLIYRDEIGDGQFHLKMTDDGKVVLGMVK